MENAGIMKMNMAFRMVLLTFLFVASSFKGQAQIMHFSMGAHSYKQSGTVIEGFDGSSTTGVSYYSFPVDESSLVPGMGFFYYQTIVAPSDIVSLGLQTGFSFFVDFQAPSSVQNQYGQTIGSTGGSDLKMGYFVPLYAMIRLGSQASKEEGDGLGGALGAGINLFGFEIPNEKGFYIPFALTASLSYKNWGIRGDLPLQDYESHYSSYTGDIPRLKNSFFSISLEFRIK